MYGQQTQTVGTLSADFGYAGYYFHAPSGLNLCTYRAYSPSLGRWINTTGHPAALASLDSVGVVARRSQPGACLRCGPISGQSPVAPRID